MSADGSVGAKRKDVPRQLVSLQCPVCLDELGATPGLVLCVITTCRPVVHYICTKCDVELRSRICPSCRKPMGSVVPLPAQACANDAAAESAHADAVKRLRASEPVVPRPENAARPADAALGYQDWAPTASPPAFPAGRSRNPENVAGAISALFAQRDLFASARNVIGSTITGVRAGGSGTPAAPRPNSRSSLEDELQVLRASFMAERVREILRLRENKPLAPGDYVRIVQRNTPHETFRDVAFLHDKELRPLAKSLTEEFHDYYFRVPRDQTQFGLKRGRLCYAVLEMYSRVPPVPDEPQVVISPPQHASPDVAANSGDTPVAESRAQVSDAPQSPMSVSSTRITQQIGAAVASCPGDGPVAVTADRDGNVAATPIVLD